VASDKETAPARRQPPEARTTKGMDFMATTSVPKAERLRTVRALALKEAIDRYNHEFMDNEERLLLLDRIKRLKQGKA
jgi:hypothetical protein